MILYLIILYSIVIAIFAETPTETVEVDLSKTTVLKLTCTGDENMFYVWSKEHPVSKVKTELRFSEKIFFPKTNIMEINNFNDLDLGAYICKLHDATVVTKRFEVIKKPSSNINLPVWHLLPHPNTKVNTGKFAVMPCRVKRRGTATVKAFRLKADGTIDKQLRDSAVVLHRPKASDSGLYMCTAKNDGGEIEHIFKVTVIVDGGYSSWSEWSQCNRLCGYGHRNQTRSCTNPAPANGGKQCRGATHKRERCRVASCSEPRLFKFGFELFTNGSLKLDCHAKGIPTPHIQWKYQGRPIPVYLNGQKSTMVLAKSHARSGTYSCYVENREGYFSVEAPVLF